MPIKYRSTRGGEKGLSFEEVVLGGLATDKGLYIPEEIPKMSLKEIEQLRGLTYVDLAYQIISKFVSPEDVASDALKNILEKSFSTFRTKEVAPSRKFKEFWVLELFHGPTFAFKDVALQFLGNLFEYFLQRGKIQQEITILGATSGDTGSAAIHGLRGKKNVNCFILYPKGKVTEIQERQMTTIPDDNVFCINIEGNFDDAQAIVKSAFADAHFREEVRLGAINSINWARVLAQITYYFYSWLRVTDEEGGKTSKLNFAVPTGNFGDILAGYYAKRMGLPIDKLIICTNENDVLHRFLQEGSYRRDGCKLTIAPSMDISVSSNFERYLFYLCGESPEILAHWMQTFESTGKVNISKELVERAKTDFLSYSSNEALILKAMKRIWDQEQYLVCPHTATAVVATEALKLPAATTVCLATAHPAKFEEAVSKSLNVCLDRPKILNDLFSLPIRTYSLPNSLGSVVSFVRERVKRKSSWKNYIGALSVTAISIAAIISISFFLASNKGRKYR